MTTVINLNILNFFKLKLNKFAVHNSVHVHSQDRDRRNNRPSEGEDVIDITPQNRVISKGEPIIKSFQKIPVPLSAYSQPMPIADTAAINKTYDRKGKTVNGGHLKGMYVDSFV